MHELRPIYQTIEKINSLRENGKKNFTVRVPSSHDIDEFESMLKQMIKHYEIPVKVDVMEVPIEIECRCGYKGEAKVHKISFSTIIFCPACKKRARILSGKRIEIV